METHPVDKEWLSYAEAQRYAGLGRTTLWQLAVKQGRIKYARVGRAVRINRHSLDEFMEHHATQPMLPGLDDADQ
jgi:excisionase family DNA binding protein